MSSFVRRSVPFVVALTACVLLSAPTAVQARALPKCPHYRSSTVMGHVSGLSGIHEISGLVSSRRYKRTLWIEQDGGNPERIDAIRPNGQARASIPVTHAKNHDWEDMSFWHHKIWIGDIGSNAGKSGSVDVYWFREPRLSAHSVRAKVVTLHYPDGGHNAEAMFVTGGNLYIVSKLKSADTGTVYRADVAPVRDGQSRRMHKIGTVPIGNISGGAVGERGFLIRNYRHGLLYRWTGDHRVATALHQRPCSVEVGPGAESITFATWNRSTFSIPEGTSPTVFVNRPR